MLRSIRPMHENKRDMGMIDFRCLDPRKSQCTSIEVFKCILCQFRLPIFCAKDILRIVDYKVFLSVNKQPIIQQLRSSVFVL